LAGLLGNLISGNRMNKRWFMLRLTA